jgi:heme/copper-type cytochrome/quinol oxidase subunit 2
MFSKPGLFTPTDSVTNNKGWYHWQCTYCGFGSKNMRVDFDVADNHKKIKSIISYTLLQVEDH